MKESDVKKEFDRYMGILLVEANKYLSWNDGLNLNLSASKYIKKEIQKDFGKQFDENLFFDWLRSQKDNKASIRVNNNSVSKLIDEFDKHNIIAKIVGVNLEE